jgi:hypothetical protein
MRHVPGNDIILGQLAGRNGTPAFLHTERDKHLYGCGGTASFLLHNEGEFGQNLF